MGSGASGSLRTLSEMIFVSCITCSLNEAYSEISFWSRRLSPSSFSRSICSSPISASSSRFESPDTRRRRLPRPVELISPSLFSPRRETAALRSSSRILSPTSGLDLSTAEGANGLAKFMTLPLTFIRLREAAPSKWMGAQNCDDFAAPVLRRVLLIVMMAANLYRILGHFWTTCCPCSDQIRF
jgi:hypothetical protein